MNTTYGENQIINLRIKRNQLIDILEYLRVGIWLERLGSDLKEITIDAPYDDSDKVIRKIENLINELNEQTGVSFEINPYTRRNFNSAYLMECLVNKECKRQQKQFWEAISKKFNLDIRPTKNWEIQQCGICSFETKPKLGKSIYTEQTNEMVCGECAARLAPELVKEMKEFEKYSMPDFLDGE